MGTESDEATSRKNSFKLKSITGNRSNTSIAAAANRKWIFVSKLIKKTTKKDIINYLTENEIDILECAKLNIKNDGIAAFKIAVRENNYEKMFDPNLWPLNVIVREYKTKNFRNTAILRMKT